MPAQLSRAFGRLEHDQLLAMLQRQRLWRQWTYDQPLDASDVWNEKIAAEAFSQSNTISGTYHRGAEEQERDAHAERARHGEHEYDDDTDPEN